MRLSLILTLLLCGGLSRGAENSEAGKHKSAPFPKVTLLKGSAQSENSSSGTNGVTTKLKLKDILLEKALIKVGDKSQLKLELDPYSSILIYENSVVELPVITWGEAEIPEIKIQNGRVFYECEKDCHRTLETPLSREVFTNGESWLEYVPESPRVELLVLHGNQEFKGLETEDSIIVHQGQKIVFQGLKEAGEVAYDTLLKGRKIARGKLQPVMTLSESDFSKLEKEFEVKRQAEKVPIKKFKRGAKQICERPLGELNQCSWIQQTAKKNKKCIRRRCNANGEWSDPQESTSCNPKLKVAPCDY
jgi:hypothetical protein